MRTLPGKEVAGVAKRITPRPERGKKERAPRQAAAPVKKAKEPTPYERVKLAMAEDLGLGEKVKAVGWAGLTAAETGRIGGLLSRQLRQLGLTVGPGGTLQPSPARQG